MIAVGILAPIFCSLELLFSRKFLGTGKYKSEKFATTVFLGIIILMIPLVIYFRPEFGNLNLKYIGAFIGVVVSALLYNLFQYKSLKRINVENAEPIILSAGVFTIILGFLFIPAERNLIDFGLASVACSILIISKLKSNFKFGKYERYLIFSVICMAFYNFFSKLVLDVMNPFALYWIRTIFLFPIFIYLSKIKLKDFKSYKNTYLISIISIAAQVTVFLSFKYLGLVKTSLFLSLIPVLSLWGAHIFLKEKIELKNIIVTALILACILLALYL